MKLELSQSIGSSTASVVADGKPLASSKQAQRMRCYAGLLLMDCVILCMSFLCANYIRLDRVFAPAGLNILSVILPVYLMVSINRGTYSMDIFRSWRRNAAQAFTSLAIATTALLIFSFYLQASATLSRTAFSIGVGLSAILLIVCRKPAVMLCRRLLSGAPEARIFIQDGLDVDLAQIPGGAVCFDAGVHGLRPDIRDPHMLDKIGRLLRHADRVLVGCPPERRSAWAMALKGADIAGEVLWPEIDALGALGASRFAQTSTLVIANGPLDTRNRVLKRSLDLTLAIGALMILAPALFFIGLAVKLDSPGPVFFRQQRLGRGNRLFSMYKFRSMRADMCDASGNRSATRDDDRITRVGRFIRSTSIDELPQFINILKGDMSFVGPRPHALGSLAGDKLFWEIDQRYWHRHAAKPGLTGLAQIRGYRGATHLQSDLVNRLQADLEYLNGWTIWRDISILLATFKVLIHRNAY